MVALSSGGQAWGDLFWDDGESLDTYETRNYCHVTFAAGQVQEIKKENDDVQHFKFYNSSESTAF